MARFISAPVLIQADPECQFIVEVDASDSGVGAVLSQRTEEDGKLRPCDVWHGYLLKTFL